MQETQTSFLRGIYVLDVSHVLAGPFCTKVLAQLCARVIKVEIPGAGDDSRAFGPFANGKALCFSAINCDKESIALNLKQATDLEIFEGLLRISVILIENFRPGTMEKLGEGESLHAKYLKQLRLLAQAVPLTPDEFERIQELQQRVYQSEKDDG
jgi:CoA:oxalate CoA-transferase